jgi:hypothetical protein
MTADGAAVAVIDALDRAAIPFMVVGSLASDFHGIPHATRDIDDTGDRFLLPAGPKTDSSVANTPLTVVVNWMAGLVKK